MRSFLSPWSFSNVYTNEGQTNLSADGKELCDLLVIFNNHVLVFSDKACSFQSNNQIEHAWPRWYKRAIKKSVDQIIGAKNWIEKYPDRLFIDRKCTKKLPVNIDSAQALRFHLIAVTRGSAEACRAHFGGGSIGSLVLDSSVVGEAHDQTPFTVGYVLPSIKFVHVFDELTLDFVFNEIDTISDFVSYLDCKEALLARTRQRIIATGEEQLLGHYLTNFNQFNISTDFDSVLFDEGTWENFVKTDLYQRRKTANEVSYIWDRLIEHLAKNIQISADTLEPALRVLATENRLARRALSKQILEVNNTPLAVGQLIRRLGVSPGRPNVAYMFQKTPFLRTNSSKYSEENFAVTELLIVACKVAKLLNPNLEKIIGLSFTFDEIHGSSEKLAFFDFSKQSWTQNDIDEAKVLQAQLKIFLDQSIRQIEIRETEFPNAAVR